METGRIRLSLFPAHLIDIFFAAKNRHALNGGQVRDHIISDITSDIFCLENTIIQIYQHHFVSLVS